MNEAKKRSGMEKDRRQVNQIHDTVVLAAASTVLKISDTSKRNPIAKTIANDIKRSCRNESTLLRFWLSTIPKSD